MASQNNNDISTPDKNRRTADESTPELSTNLEASKQSYGENKDVTTFTYSFFP